MSSGTVASAGLADPSDPSGPSAAPGPAAAGAAPAGGGPAAVARPPRAERAARAQEAVERLRPAGVDAVAVTWIDNAGIARVKAVPLTGLVHAAEWGVGAAPCFDVFLADDSLVTSRLIGGPTGDLRLYPDLDRLVPLAAQPGWAWSPGSGTPRRAHRTRAASGSSPAG